MNRFPRRAAPGLLLLSGALAAAAPACSSSSDAGDAGAAGAGVGGAGGASASGGKAGASASGPGGAAGSNTGTGGDAGAPGGAGASGAGASGASGSAGSSGGSPVPVSTCALPLMAADTSSPTTVVGSGSAASCTEQALSDAVAKGGVITFNCGGPATIAITSEKMLPKGIDTTLDGGGQITLDGGDKTRLLHFEGGDYRKTKTVLTLQHITLANGHAQGSKMFPPANPPCSQGYQDGSGGAVLVNDGVVHVLDVTFQSNQAASPGPDVGGGGLYVSGSLEALVVGSRFLGNQGSNGGGIGSLNSELTVVNTLFDSNQATGRGANSTNATCPVVGGQREIGNGGNAAAVGIDGGSDGTHTFCGDVFKNNAGHALGGAIFRTPDGSEQDTVVDQCTFDGNHVAPAQDMNDVSGGGAFYLHNTHLIMTRTTLSNNNSDGCGAIQSDGSTLELTNVTLAGNTASSAPGGALCLFGNGATLTNCTFLGNTTKGDPGKGIAANVFGPGTAITVNNTLFDATVSKDGGVPNCLSNLSGAHDLQWPQSGNGCAVGIAFSDPMLGALGDNGGPTQTALPASASPAKGQGHGCPSTDQRGNARPADGCTLGAVELP